mmetsp:Transcript_10059/g.31595  ORF Transcript_10059/g.31595 Transcript_10059/m.31595 type:complete len:627 (-) Transcript_10059:91-1971(-)
MEQLARLLQGLKSSARVQAVLKSLVVILDDVLSHPTEEQQHRVRLDEITPVSAKLLESCGFVEDSASGELRLPPGVDLRALRDAREDLAALLKKAELAGESAVAAASHVGAPAAAADAAGDSLAASGPLAVAPAVAMALQLAATSISPTVTLPAMLAPSASDDTLGAASPSDVKPRNNGGNRDTSAHKGARTVPPSVASAAAAVGQAVATAGPSAILASGVGSLGHDPGAAVAKAPGRGNAGGGASRWVAAPSNVLPESRLIVALPEAEFTYIERPWSHFVTRWAAIDVELGRLFGEGPFSLMDIGSCCGFFSLQAAAGYPDALVIGLEGSVGIGNGTSGVGGTEEQIIATKAVQTHLRWIQQLDLSNCLLAPEVWDYRRICQLALLGRPICDAMLTLSVIHHIDNVSTQQYGDAGLTHLQGTVSLMTKLLDLAPRHFVELPDRPWLEHIYIAYGGARAFLEAAVKASGRNWSFVGPLCVSEWYGTRELWLLEEVDVRASTIPTVGLQALFPRTLGTSAARQLSQAVPTAPQGNTRRVVEEAPAPPPAAAAAPRPPAAAELPQQPSQTPAPQPAPLNLGALGTPLTSEELGAALLAAPTALIAAHVQLRDALAGADGLLQHVRSLK